MVAQIKGSAIKARIDYLSAHFGEDGLRRVRDVLAPAHVEHINQGILVTTWYPLSLNLDILGCSERLLGRGDGKLCREMGSASAKNGLRGVHRAFSGLALDAEAIAHKMSRSTQLLWKVHYDTGTMETRATGTRTIASRLIDLPLDSPWMCHVLTGYLGTHIEVLGGRGVNVEHVSCRVRGDAECVWHSRWD